MTKKIPPTTKKFLTQLMEEKIHQNPGDNLIEFKNSYINKFTGLNENRMSYESFKKMADTGKPFGVYVPPEYLKRYEEEKKNKQNFGIGDKEKEKKTDSYWDNVRKQLIGTDRNPKDIMLGDTDATGTLLTPGAIIGGSVIEYLGKGLGSKAARAIASRIPGGLGQVLGGKAGRAIGKAGEAFSDILGGPYVDVNADDISFQNMRNMIQGAGSPFYKLQLPARQDDRYDWWRKMNLASSSSP